MSHHIVAFDMQGELQFLMEFVIFGISYADPINEITSAGVHAVAEPVEFRRTSFGRKYIWGADGTPSEGQEFTGWKEWCVGETDRRRRQKLGESVPDGVDGVLVCTLDETHVDIMCAIAPLDLHVLCEKPLATSLEDCLFTEKSFLLDTCCSIVQHNIMLKKLLLTDKAIGDLLSIEHVEPVGWWHFAHSYVRRNWRRETKNRDGSLLTKCSHDIDFLLWLLAVPAEETQREPHLPRIHSLDGIPEKPAAANGTTNCISCPIERECQYIAIGNPHWVKNVIHDIEDLMKAAKPEMIRTTLLHKLAEDYDRSTTSDKVIAARPWYGRCVYESDNDVCDDQLVILSWDEDVSSSSPGKRAMLHMIANTEDECIRRGRVYGTSGELTYNSHTITYFCFLTRKKTVIDVPRQSSHEMRSHGGGDYGLIRAFIAAIEAVQNEEMWASEAQCRFIGGNLEDAVLGHAMVFAAEARRDDKVISWKDWWDTKTA
ncbi:hypothetical protein P175DRAFT_0516820 [Aspergillus ochraceoroseus IBT 24754]|uniref:Gfo/Idh/MocA-like oxidoreductase N-terminal domain-containing protein n=1 Tax=Aspergillus ochraceoroseus IBT 24754 TaxID=1392256 RepID=A0A2T5LYC8_9EURO|nr:uncharacterized protein P175DRAFT_0516820 [Aspergillus ochraceoroseus IBT 24754]PTU21286.1 hypothetical protein P175DRAFT_0516820 [Aspergillus ochraceoroseus IBT 24754]